MGWAHVQVCKPKDFASQINLSMENCWGIVRAVADLCLKLDEGKYLLVKVWTRTQKVIQSSFVTMVVWTLN